MGETTYDGDDFRTKKKSLILGISSSGTSTDLIKAFTMGILK